MDAADLAIIETYEAHLTPLERELVSEVRRLQALWEEREEEENEEIVSLKDSLREVQRDLDNQEAETRAREEEIAGMANEISALEDKLAKTREACA